MYVSIFEWPLMLKPYKNDAKLKPYQFVDKLLQNAHYDLGNELRNVKGVWIKHKTHIIYIFDINFQI